MIEELRRYQRFLKDAETAELSFKTLYLDTIQRQLRGEIERSAIPPTLIDYFAPSREGCDNIETWSNLNTFGSTEARNYAIMYPWGLYPANVFSTGKSGVFAELTSEGTFRCYIAMTRPVYHGGYYAGHDAVSELRRVELPEETDLALLELQALKFLNFLKKGDFKLVEGGSPEGLPENSSLVKNNSSTLI